MKIWKEYEPDVFKYFDYFNKEKIDRNINEFPKMSVFSVNASGIYGYDNKKEFIERVSGEIEYFCNKNGLLDNYKFYLFVNIEVINKNSRVENYMKAWKKISKKVNIEGFILGEETIMEVGNLSFFSGIAEIPIEYLSKAIEIVSLNPERHTIFMSKSKEILSGQYNQKLFNIGFNNNNSFNNLNYFLLSLKCCKDGDIAIRYGTSFTEAELALIYNPALVKISN